MLDDRFWAKVDKTSPCGCWIWTANRNNKGYGMFSCRGMGFLNKKLAHRLSFSDAFGAIEDGKHILHSCDNPACVNPSHLSAGTRSDNMRDSANKFRAKTRKVTEETHKSLIWDYVAGMPRATIAAKYGIPINSISDYLSGRIRSWKFGSNGLPSYEQIKAAKQMRPNAKLTPEIVADIKERLSRGETGLSIARLYGVHFGTVSDIKIGKTWR
jgi:hypothetical protein